MIKLPYYNENDVDLLPFNATKNSDGTMRVDGFSFTFENTADYFYLKFDAYDDYGYQNVAISCGDFLGGLNYNYNRTEKDIAGTTFINQIGKGTHTYEFSFEQKDDGLHVNISSPGLIYSNVFSDKKIGNVSVSWDRVTNLSNIVASNSKNDTYFASTQDITVDSIDNWEINNSGEYVLTNMDKTGVVHINQEKIDKLLADNDIVSCAIVMTTEKRGTKLKSMEFAVGDKKNTVEIPEGKGKIMIPLDFENGTDMKNITLTVRG